MNFKHSDTEIIVKKCILDIEEGIWKILASQNIQKMVPLSTQAQTSLLVDQLCSIVDQQKKIIIPTIKQQIDPIPAIQDLLQPCTPKLINLKMNNKSMISINRQQSQTKDQKKINGLLNIQPKDIKIYPKINSQKCIILTQENCQETQQSRAQNRFIRLYTEGKQQEKKRERLKRQKQIQIQNTNRKNIKTFKELKSFAFDYQGKFFGIKSQSKTQNRILNLRSEYSNSRKVEKSNQIIKQSIIKNDKINSRNSRFGQETNGNQLISKLYSELNQHRDGIIKQFLEEDSLSAGVTIKEKSEVKSKPWKKNNVDIVKQLKLEEFRSYIRGKQFRDHHKTKLKTAPNTIDNKSDINSVAKPRTQGSDQYKLKNYMRFESQIISEYITPVNERKSQFPAIKPMKKVSLINSLKSLPINPQPGKIKINNCELFSEIIAQEIYQNKNNF